MQIHLTARHCEVSPAIRAFAASRLEKLQKYDSAIQEVRIIVSQERRVHTAEITLRTHQQDVVITERHEDVRGAIELAADRLEERVRRSKEKRVIAPRREARGNGALPPEPAGDADEAAEDQA